MIANDPRSVVLYLVNRLKKVPINLIFNWLSGEDRDYLEWIITGLCIGHHIVPVKNSDNKVTHIQAPEFDEEHSDTVFYRNLSLASWVMTQWSVTDVCGCYCIDQPPLYLTFTLLNTEDEDPYCASCDVAVLSPDDFQLGGLVRCAKYWHQFTSQQAPQTPQNAAEYLKNSTNTPTLKPVGNDVAKRYSDQGLFSIALLYENPSKYPADAAKSLALHGFTHIALLDEGYRKTRMTDLRLLDIFDAIDYDSLLDALEDAKMDDEYDDGE